MNRASIVLACALPLFAACTTQPQPPSRAAAPTPVHVDADTLFRGVADAIPDYAGFLTRRFYALLAAGQFVRLLETERARTGSRFPAALQKELAAALTDFERRAGELEVELHYTIVPIKTLATVQLLTAFYAMDYLQKR